LETFTVAANDLPGNRDSLHLALPRVSTISDGKGPTRKGTSNSRDIPCQWRCRPSTRRARDDRDAPGDPRDWHDVLENLFRYSRSVQIEVTPLQDDAEHHVRVVWAVFGKQVSQKPSFRIVRLLTNTVPLVSCLIVSVPRPDSVPLLSRTLTDPGA
jgi:hypothetical protein